MSAIYFEHSIRRSPEKGLLQQFPKFDPRKIGQNKPLSQLIQGRGFISTISKGRSNRSRGKALQVSCRSIELAGSLKKTLIRAAKSIQTTPFLCRSDRKITKLYQMRKQDLRNTVDTMNYIPNHKVSNIYTNSNQNQTSLSPRQFRKFSYKNCSTAQNSPKKDSCFSPATPNSSLKLTQTTSCIQIKEVKAPSFLKKRNACKAQECDQSGKLKVQKPQSNIPSFLKKRQCVKTNFKIQKQTYNELQGIMQIKQCEKNPQNNVACLAEVTSKAKQIEAKNDLLIGQVSDMQEGCFKRLEFMKHTVTKTQELISSSPQISEIDNEGMKTFANLKLFTKFI